MNLTLDIGNTRIKAGLFKGRECLGSFAFTAGEWPQALTQGAQMIAPAAHIQYIGILSVGKMPLETAITFLSREYPNAQILALQPGLSTPLISRYATPATLGMDRLALANGAWAESGGRPLIAFSAGTALTWEVVSAAGEYLGGGIAPGMRMRFMSLHEGTANLPLIQPEGDFSLTGKSTEESIRSGVMLGMIHEIEGLAAQAIQELGPHTQVFLTGGDAVHLGNHLKKVNFADSGLVLKGINAIIQSHFADA